MLYGLDLEGPTGTEPTIVDVVAETIKPVHVFVSDGEVTNLLAADPDSLQHHPLVGSFMDKLDSVELIKESMSKLPDELQDSVNDPHKQPEEFPPELLREAYIKTAPEIGSYMIGHDVDELIPHNQDVYIENPPEGELAPDPVPLSEVPSQSTPSTTHEPSLSNETTPARKAVSLDTVSLDSVSATDKSVLADRSDSKLEPVAADDPSYQPSAKHTSLAPDTKDESVQPGPTQTLLQSSVDSSSLQSITDSTAPHSKDSEASSVIAQPAVLDNENDQTATTDTKPPAYANVPPAVDNSLPPDSNAPPAADYELAPTESAISNENKETPTQDFNTPPEEVYEDSPPEVATPEDSSYQSKPSE